MWQNMYIGIRKANKIIENIDRIPNFPSDEIKDRCLGEAYFLRAFFYFELIKRWGGVPIIDHTLVLNQDNLIYPATHTRNASSLSKMIVKLLPACCP